MQLRVRDDHDRIRFRFIASWLRRRPAGFWRSRDRGPGSGPQTRSSIARSPASGGYHLLCSVSRPWPMAAFMSFQFSPFPFFGFFFQGDSRAEIQGLPDVPGKRRGQEPLRRDDGRRARSRRRGRQDQVFDDQLQGCAVLQRRRQDHAQVPDRRRHRHGGNRRHIVRPAIQAWRQGDRACLRRRRRARRRLRRVRARARPTGSCVARKA